MHWWIYLLIILATILLVGGVVMAALFHWAGVRGSGNITSETRTVGTFARVTVSGAGNLYLTQGAPAQVRIETDDNILPYIRSEVRGDTLHLSPDGAAFGGVHPTRSINYYVTVPDLQGVATSGSASINTQAFKADRLELRTSGSGTINMSGLDVRTLVTSTSGSADVDLAGTVERQEYSSSGSGRYRARDLVSQEAVIRISGSGNATVNVAKRLEVSISGSGDVQYLGTPQVSQRISGAGSVRQAP